MHQTTPSSLRIFSVALFCQIATGVEYWWPALLTSLQPRLHLTPTQSLILAALANSGGTLGIPAGFFHSRHGSRITALLGSLSLALSFLILAILPFGPTHLSFPVAFAATGLTVPASYALYAASVSLPSAVFPASFRGRVIGLLATAYASSAAIYGSIQSAFFPHPENMTALLLTSATIPTLAAILIALFYPHADHFDTEPYYLLEPNQQTPTTHPPDALLSTRMQLAYRLVIALVVFLQLGTISEAISAPSIFLKLSVFAMLPVVILLLTYVPHNSPLRVRPTLVSDTEPSGSILSVIQDARFHFLSFARFLVIGGGGLTVLIQSHNIVASRLALTQPDAIPAAVRTLVLVFSTSNLTARLFVGLAMDAPTEEESFIRKYNILHSASLILAVTLPVLALMPYWGILWAMVVVGSCHGIYFSTAPALCTLWFDARQYPRNWSAIGPFHSVSIVTLATMMPAFFMAQYGTWVGAGEERTCVGIMCTFPTFAVIALFDLLLYGAGWKLKKSLQA